MILLVLFAFFAGIITILSPCILPILPIVLSGGLTHDKKKPIGIIIGFIASFTFFTLFLSALVKAVGIPAESLRFFSIIVIGILGVGLVVPQFQKLLEIVFSRLARFAPSGNTHKGLFGGIIIGLSLGLLWTPCVGPILASVISLAITGNVTSGAFFITLAYSLGTAIPMFLIMISGRALFQKVPWILSNTAKIQKGFGLLMVLTALAIFFNIDRKFQTFILETFPSYGAGLTGLEDNSLVQKSLDRISADTSTLSNITNIPIDSAELSSYGLAPEIIAGGEWFNSAATTLASLRGKVVLIDFWTYTCINCQRTLPYLRDWHQKYKDDGLVIIGVHTPEFEFEKNAENVTTAVEDFELEYPIVQDNNYSTWNAYGNRYWPAKYLIDKEGIIRYFHFGEGEYDKTENAIQELLGGTKMAKKEINNPAYSVDTNTPEIYLGYARIEYFDSPESIKKDRAALYSFSSKQKVSTFSYSGNWLIGGEYSMPEKNSVLRLGFDSKKVFLVARPKKQGLKGAISVKIDGKTPSTLDQGVDVSGGVVSVSKDTLFNLVNFSEQRAATLEILFLDGNLEIYAFTFG